MKKVNFYGLFLVLLFPIIVLSQVGIGTITPDASSILDISSTTKGLLLPRMTTLQQTDLESPAIGLMVYNTTTNQIETNQGDGMGGASWAGASTKGTTATIGTNTTQLATTEFVISNSNKYNSINGTSPLLTTATVDAVMSGMTISPPAGTYFVNFNSQFNYTPAPVISAPVEISTAQAVIDLQAAYDQLNAIAVTDATHAAVFGNGETLTPGVYSVAAAASMLGTLTLDGQNNPNAVFIFKIGAAFNTGAGTTVLLTNGASACNVFWVVEAAIGLGAITKIKGTMISHGAAVGAGAGCIIDGRMLTTAGAITSDNVTLNIPLNCSYINLGVLSTFAMFTTAGGIANTAISSVNGNVGTDFGLITGLTPIMVTGTIFPPGGTAVLPVATPPITSGFGTFSIYQNGVLIANSNRTRKSTLVADDVTLQAIATVEAGQTIDIRWKTDQGGLTVGNRIVTLINIR
ncbi:Ice-binding protein [Flavobacteriaceae bacterium]